MKKRTYVQPSIRVMGVNTEGLMITASPGVGGNYDPNKPLDAKPYMILPEEMEDDELLEEGGWANW